MRSLEPSHGKAGFTIIELGISTSIFLVIATVLLGAIRMGNSSTNTVMQVTTTSAELRRATKALQDELGTTTEAELTIAVLPDGNHQVDFRVPVLNGANFDWGVFSSAYGPTPAEQNRVDWSLRYTVDLVDGTNRRLLRQVLDDAGVLQEQQVLVEGLRRGDAADPGFQLVQVGDIWELTVTTVGATANTNGRMIQFHVRLRN